MASGESRGISARPSSRAPRPRSRLDSSTGRRFVWKTSKGKSSSSTSGPRGVRRAGARVLEEAWRKYKDDGVVFLGINTQDTEEAARKFLEEYSITYPNGQDPGGRIAIDYGTWGLPESFFIDAAGQITYKHVGAIGWDTLLAKVEEARRGVVSAGEGRGEYQSSR